MKKFEFIAPCHFGLEAVLKREIQDLGYEVSAVEDGRVSFYGDINAVCRANIFLRTAERVLLKAGQFKATTFEELFDKTKEIVLAHLSQEANTKEKALETYYEVFKNQCICFNNIKVASQVNVVSGEKYED